MINKIFADLKIYMNNFISILTLVIFFFNAIMILIMMVLVVILNY
jgi:hypothetical protein